MAGRPARAAACCCSRTSASTPRRRRTTPPSPRGLIARHGRHRLRERRLRHRPPRPRLHGGRLAAREDVGGGAPHGEGAAATWAWPWRRPSGPSWPCSAGPRSPTRSRSSRACCRAWTRCSIGGGMAYTFFRAQGLRHRQEPGGGGQGRPGEGAARRRRKGKIRLPVGPRGGRGLQGGRRAPDAAASTEIPEGWMGLDIGPATATAFARGDARREDRLLERAHGRLRDEAVRRGHAGRGPGPGRQQGHHASWAAATAWPRSRRWAWPTRSTTSPPAAGPRSSSWRRAAARRRLPGGRALRPMRRPLIAGNWKMHRTVARGRRAGRATIRAGLERGRPTVDVVIAPPFTALARGGARS